MKIMRNICLPTINENEKYDLLILKDRFFITKPGDVLIRNNVCITEIDAEDYLGLPGLIDCHIHLLGGGSLLDLDIAEPFAEDLYQNGITGVIGSLGFDDTTKTITSLIAKTKKLRKKGITAFCLVGGFNYPLLSLTGYFKKDLIFISEVIGIGEFNIDNPMIDTELANLILQCYQAGKLASKAGVIQIHLNNQADSVNRLIKIIKDYALPINSIHLTHVNYNEDVLEVSANFAKLGGFIDITTNLPLAIADAIPPVTAIIKLLERGVEERNITLSTDGYGISYKNRQVFPTDTLLSSCRELIKMGFSIKRAWSFASFNVSEIYKLPQLGEIANNFYANLLLFDKDMNEMQGLLLAGKYMQTK